MKNFKFIDSDEQPVEYDGSPINWRVSVYGLVVKDDSLLMIKMDVEKLYDIPGGGVDIGESLQEALNREALEEAGVKLKLGKIISVNSDFFYHRDEKKYYQTIQLFYTAKMVGKMKKPTDPRIEFVDFIKFSDLKNYPIFTAIKQAILAHPEFDSGQYQLE